MLAGAVKHATWETMFSSISDTGDSEEKIRVLPTRVEPMTFWLLVQMLYHWATGDLWELRPFNIPTRLCPLIEENIISHLLTRLKIRHQI